MNWGTGVVIAMVSFMVFILTFVYRSVVMDKYQHELVSEDYYKDELHYQEEIDKMNNAGRLETDIQLVSSKEGITVVFPSDLDPGEISGTIRCQRPSNQKLDLKLEIELSENRQLISAERLVPGKYQIIVDWKYGSEEYLLKDVIFF